MNVNLGIWDKLTRLIILLMVLATLMGIGLWYLPLIRQNERMRKEILTLEAEIKAQEESQRRLKADLDALQDPRTIERLAREKLNYARPGETVVRFEAPQTNGTPGAPRSSSGPSDLR
jgi:cell division protein FtsB